MIPKCIKQKQLGEQVDKMSTYSTEEQVIGKWIDGRNLYRKVVVYSNTDIIGANNKTVNIDIPHNILNFKQAINVSAVDSSGCYILPSLASSEGNIVNISTSIHTVDTSNIKLRIINNTWGPRTWYITLEYIKTTD